MSSFVVLKDVYIYLSFKKKTSWKENHGTLSSGNCEGGTEEWVWRTASLLFTLYLPIL